MSTLSRVEALARQSLEDRAAYEAGQDNPATVVKLSQNDALAAYAKLLADALTKDMGQEGKEVAFGENVRKLLTDLATLDCSYHALRDLAAKGAQNVRESQQKADLANAAATRAAEELTNTRFHLADWVQGVVDDVLYPLAHHADVPVDVTELSQTADGYGQGTPALLVLLRPQGATVTAQAQAVAVAKPLGNQGSPIPEGRCFMCMLDSHPCNLCKKGL